MMLQNMVYTAVFTVAVLLVVGGHGISEKPTWKQLALGCINTCDGVSNCLSVIKDVNKLQEHPIFHKADEILSQWENISRKVSSLDINITLEKFRNLNKSLDELKSNTTIMNATLGHRVADLEDVLKMNPDTVRVSDVIERLRDKTETLKGNIDTLEQGNRNNSGNVLQLDERLDAAAELSRMMQNAMNKSLDELKLNTTIINATLGRRVAVMETILEINSDDGVNNVIETMRKETKTVKKFIENLEQNKRNLTKRILHLDRRLDAAERKSRLKQKAINAQVEQVEQSGQQSHKTMEEQLKQINNTQEGYVSTLETEVKRLRSKVEDVTKQAKDNKMSSESLQDLANTRHIELMKRTDEMRNRLYIYENVFMVVVAVAVVMFAMKLMTRREWTAEPRTPSRRRETITSKARTLNWSGPMENSICVVTFHSETQRQHVDETRSVFESLDDTPPFIQTRVIRSHADIQDLPGCRVYLVYVDFNERNVILEDPAKGLGDLRLITVRSLLQFGGDVSVIYCRDRGSRSLGRELFNRDLTSIYSQQELSTLQSQHRMISIFDDFSDFQKQHCREFINRQLKRV